MPAVVSSVVQGSIADELEIEEGDILLSIDGEKLLDMIDYRFLCKNEFITIEIQKKNGEIIYEDKMTNSLNASLMTLMKI